MQAPSIARAPYPRRPTHRRASSSAINSATSGESRRSLTFDAKLGRANRDYTSFGQALGGANLARANEGSSGAAGNRTRSGEFVRLPSPKPGGPADRRRTEGASWPGGLPF